MNMHNKNIGKRCRWRIGLGGSLLSSLLLLSTWAAAAQPEPADTAGASWTTAAPKAYVALHDESAIAVLDTGTNRMLGTISVPLGPHGLVMTPDGRKVYVSSDEVSTVSVIDTATDRVVSSIEVGPMPAGLAISPDGRHVLASVWGADQVVMIDTGTDRIVGHVPVPQPQDVAINPDGNTAYISSGRIGAAALYIVDLASRLQIGKVSLDRHPSALALSLNGRRLYFTVEGEDAVQGLDLTRNRVTAGIPVGASPPSTLIPPDGQSQSGVSQSPNVLRILDPARDVLAASLIIGKTPHWIATSPDGRTAYVTNERSNDVSVVNLAQRMVTLTIPVGFTPREIAVQPAPTAPSSVSSPAPGRGIP